MLLLALQETLAPEDRNATIPPLMDTFSAARRWALFPLLLTVLSGRAFAGEDPEALIRQGVALRKAGEDSKAQGYFQRAYDIARTPRSAAQLGLCEYALGMWSPAEAHLSEALGATEDSWIRGTEATLRESLATVRTHLGRLRISGTPTGAHVRTAGVERGQLPIDRPLYLAPGSHAVEVSAEGYETQRRTATVVAGEEVRLDVELASSGGSVAELPAAANRETPPARSDVRWPHRLAWGTAAGAAALLLGGTVALVASNHDYDDFNHKLVSGTSDPLCSRKQVDKGGPECQDLLSAGDRNKTLAIIGFAGAGALAVTSAILFVTSRDLAGEDRTVACAPGIGGVSATCAWRF